MAVQLDKVPVVAVLLTNQMKISVIIPVLNEAGGIFQTLSNLQALRQRGHEVIVVDGKSHDDTMDIALPLSDAVIQVEKGRARQMQAGAELAKGDVLWFLHADTIAPQNADIVIKQVLDKKNWGWFNVVITSRFKLLKLVASIMNLRSSITGVCTGDQGMFIKTELFRQAGGFPLIPIMEDIALSKKLKKQGRPACVKEVLHTSGRRWEEKGIIRTVFLMWALRFLYFVGVDPKTLKHMYK